MRCCSSASQRRPGRGWTSRPGLDIPGVLLVSGAVFCLVYGFSNAAAHRWATPSTYGFLAAGVALGGQGRPRFPGVMSMAQILGAREGGDRRWTTTSWEGI